MLAYVVCAIDFKYEVRSDLRACLEATVASKPHFLGWSPIDGSSIFSQRTIFSKVPQKSPKILKDVSKNPQGCLQKSISSFLSRSAAGLLGPNLVIPVVHLL